MKVGFIGHEEIKNEAVIDGYLYSAIDKELEIGADTFYVALFGDFSFLARLYLIKQKEKYPNIKIIGVASNYDEEEIKNCQNDLDDILYICKEDDTYNKSCADCYEKITDNCDRIICFVSNRLPVAYSGFCYAKKTGRDIINLNKYFKDEFFD